MALKISAGFLCPVIIVTRNLKIVSGHGLTRKEAYQCGVAFNKMQHMAKSLYIHDPITRVGALTQHSEGTATKNS